MSPDPYVDAPPVLREMNAVLALTRQLRRPGGRTPEAVREQRMRKAALLDRIALQEVAEYAPEVAATAVHTAETAARTLAEYDREHGTGKGVSAPDGSQWAPSHRPYVRQEYDAWQRTRS